MSEAESTSVDVLIARLEPHPDEFFCREAVSAYDGARIFASTKWRRITTSLMVDKAPGEQNLWMDLFTPEERERFRAAMYKALRAELDTQIMRVLVGEDPFKFNPEGLAAQQKQAQWASHQAILQGFVGQTAAHPGSLRNIGISQTGTATAASTTALTQSYNQSMQDLQAKIDSIKQDLEDEEQRFTFGRLADRVKGWL